MKFTIESIDPASGIWLIRIVREDGKEVQLNISDSGVRTLTSGRLEIETHATDDLTVVILFEDGTQ